MTIRLPTRRAQQSFGALELGLEISAVAKRTEGDRRRLSALAHRWRPGLPAIESGPQGIRAYADNSCTTPDGLARMLGPSTTVTVLRQRAFAEVVTRQGPDDENFAPRPWAYAERRGKAFGARKKQVGRGEHRC